MSNLLSRRKFLQGAAIAMAAPHFITARAMGANERLGVGFIGIGGMGGGHFGNLLNNDSVRIRAVCDVRREIREARQAEVNQKYGATDCAAYNDFRELVARDDIDAVVISTPDHWHALISLAAMRSGKDVYCEKPLTLTVHEGRAVADTAARYGRIFQTGTQQRSDWRFRTACELVRNGRIGKVQKIEIGLPDNGPTSHDLVVPEEAVPDGLDYEMWLGEAPWKPYNSQRVANWRAFRDYSGGVMTDWGAHHFDIAQWALGMDGSGPTEVLPASAEQSLTYLYPNGTRMYLAGSNGVKFIGEAGSIFVTRGDMWTEPQSIGFEPIASSDVRLYESNNHMENWLAGIRTRRQPICPAWIGLSSVTVAHIGNIATWLGRDLKWDPKQEKFIGDAEANRWLDRPRRAPWHL